MSSPSNPWPGSDPCNDCKYCCNRSGPELKQLATLTAINNLLQKENEKLRADLEAAEQPSNVTEADLEELKEEFARRLAANDKQIASLKVPLLVYQPSQPMTSR